MLYILKMMRNVIARVFFLWNRLFFRSRQQDANYERPIQVRMGSEIFEIEFISNTIDVDGKAYIRGKCENIDEGDCIILEFGNSENIFYVDKIDYFPHQSEMFTAMITKITSN